MSDISFALFQKSHVDRNTIIQTRNLPLTNAHATAILLISEGINIWSLLVTSELKSFRNRYLTELSALPTNTQFVERGIEESGYVSLGRKNETNHTVLAIAPWRLSQNI